VQKFIRINASVSKLQQGKGETFYLRHSVYCRILWRI